MLVEVEGVEGDGMTGTQVELHGVDLPDEGGRRGTIAPGFRCRCGSTASRSGVAMAEANLATQASAVGAMHLAETCDGLYTRYLGVPPQGFSACNAAGRVHPRDVNVVRLDSRQFTARLPDATA